MARDKWHPGDVGWSDGVIDALNQVVKTLVITFRWEEGWSAPRMFLVTPEEAAEEDRQTEAVFPSVFKERG